MKNRIFKTTTVLMALAAFFGCTVDNKVIDNVFEGVQKGAFLRTIEITNAELDINDTSSFIGVVVEYQDAEKSTLLSEVKVYGSFEDKNGNGNSKSDVLVKSIPASTFVPVPPFNLPQATIQVTLGELLSALGMQVGDYFGSDVFTMRLEVVLTDGRTYSAKDANGNIAALGGYYSSPYAYAAPIVCPPKPPAAGDWVISMEDTYGDGWQTDDGSGGSGITITLNDGTVFEVGLCSPYQASTFTCTPGDYSGTATITIPSGTQTADWYFPGDAYGEIKFTITTPNGNVAAIYGTGSPAGPIAIDFCVD
jgi:hypothetical protein